MPEPKLAEDQSSAEQTNEQYLTNIITFFNAMAMDENFDPTIRTRAVTAAEKSQLILGALRRSRMKALRKALKPPDKAKAE